MIRLKTLLPGNCGWKPIPIPQGLVICPPNQKKTTINNPAALALFIAALMVLCASIPGRPAKLTTTAVQGLGNNGTESGEQTNGMETSVSPPVDGVLDIADTNAQALVIGGGVQVPSWDFIDLGDNHGNPVVSSISTIGSPADLLRLSSNSPSCLTPIIPVGSDAYLQWDRWPCQRIGARAYMRSTYDRNGGFFDEKNYLYQLSGSNSVTIDVEGTGVLYFARYNHWHGSPWHYVVDGTDNVVQETSTANPNRPVAGSVFLPTNAFPAPLTETWSTTQGADLSWVPISFQNSFRMGYERTHYGTGYYIYDLYMEGANLSQPIATWNNQIQPPLSVLNLINQAGTDISPTNNVTDISGSLPLLSQGQTNLLLLLTNTSASIRKLSFSISPDQAVTFGRARLRITWDNRSYPSIDAPVALFHGAGTLYNREGREYLVKAFPSWIRYSTQSVELAFLYPMPFLQSARIELIGPATNFINHVNWTVRYEPFTNSCAEVGYFHATYRDHGVPKLGQDNIFLDTRDTEGGGDWSGSFVGTSFIFSDVADLNTLEGDPRFYFDDSQTPQAYGTGTEEWGGGGDFWGGIETTLPFAGHPTGAPSISAANNAEDEIESANRFLLGDLMPFGKNAVISFEHGGADESTQHYQSVTYWYGAPTPTLVLTDQLKVGDPVSEAAHHYDSPQASAPYSIISRYEWGPDTSTSAGGVLITNFPATTDSGRITTGASEFTLKLNPQNLGVLLRRKLDYAYPNQRAQVFIADGSRGEPAPSDWNLAGTWYLAGACTWVSSNPGGELDATEHTVQTSNRRFRDDEFLVPPRLTHGHSAIRFRIQFLPLNLPLFPGRVMDPQAWSEMRYDVYSYVHPFSLNGYAISNGNFTINWWGGTLQSTTNLNFPTAWSNISTGTSFTEPAARLKFYRIIP
jgi:hypothetical protein